MFYDYIIYNLGGPNRNFSLMSISRSAYLRESEVESK